MNNKVSINEGSLINAAFISLYAIHKNQYYTIMTNRVDKGIGFPGGIIDAGEDKVTSAKREFKEEVGLDININDVDYISTFKCGNVVAHQYLKKVNFDYLIECIKHQHLSKDFLSENTGLMILRFDNLSQYDYNSMNFKNMVKEEIEIMTSFIKMLN